METRDVPVREYLWVVAVVTLAFLVVLTPMSVFGGPSGWVEAEAKAIAAARATATASALLPPEESAVAATSEQHVADVGLKPADASAQGSGQDEKDFAVDLVTDDVVGPGMVAGTVYDALNGEPLPDVRIKVPSARRVAISNRNGRYNLRSIPEGPHELAVSNKGYLQVTETVEVPGAGTDGINFILSPLLQEGQYRIVLGWGDTPRDLDAHLWFPANRANHVYHPTENRISLDGSAKLDIDAKRGRGPETITIDRLYEGTYGYAVYQFTSEGSMSGSGVYVRVFTAAGLLQTFNPPRGRGRWWVVFALDGATGKLQVVNVLTDVSPAPYPFP